MVSFWIYKFDPQIFTIDDLRFGTKLSLKNIGPKDNDIVLFLNGHSNSFEAIGKINDYNLSEALVAVKVLNKPRQVGLVTKVTTKLPKESIRHIVSLSFQSFLSVNPSAFDKIIGSWWGIEKYSKGLMSSEK